MTPYGLFAVAILAPLAVAVLGFTIARRRRDQPVGRWRGAAAVSSGLFLVLSALAVAGWALPDAFDRLPAAERRAVAPALQASPECGLLPFARVVKVDARRRTGEGVVLRYTCGMTPFGLPRFTNEAHCADGQWTGPAVMDHYSAAGSCVDF